MTEKILIFIGRLMRFFDFIFKRKKTKKNKNDDIYPLW